MEWIVIMFSTQTGGFYWKYQVSAPSVCQISARLAIAQIFWELGMAHDIYHPVINHGNGKYPIYIYIYTLYNHVPFLNPSFIGEFTLQGLTGGNH